MNAENQRLFRLAILLGAFWVLGALSSPVSAIDCCYLECLIAIPEVEEAWSECLVCYCQDDRPCDPVVLAGNNAFGYTTKFAGYRWIYTCVEDQESCGDPPAPACGDKVPDETWWPAGFPIQLRKRWLSGAMRHFLPHHALIAEVRPAGG